MQSRDNTTVQSVDRAIRLLEKIAENPGSSLGSSELANHISVDKSSAFRLLATLANHDLVRQDESRKGYCLGYGIFSLAGALRDQTKITDIVSPFLKSLAQKTHENAHLAVKSGTRAVFIDRERAANTIAANTSIGDSEELYCTAVGKSLICNLSEEELSDLLAPVEFRKYTEDTIVDLASIEKEIRQVERRGYAYDLGEYENHVYCIASPIFDFEGKIEAAIGISGPKDRMLPELERFTHEVLQAGREISRILGSRRSITNEKG